MNCEEFSNGFDTLVSSYRRFKDYDNKENLDSVEFDEYEKSFYLTRAQEQLIVTYYNGKNYSADSFENTEEIRRYLANIVEEDIIKPIESTNGLPVGVNSKSKFFTLPSDVWFITYENVNVDDPKCDAYNPMDVYPVTQDDYNKTKRNPFRGANDRRALRLDLADGVIEIICKYNVVSYYIRYLRKPRPIVLKDLPNGLSIEGERNKSECELHEALHQKILEGAVAEALRSKITTKEDNE